MKTSKARSKIANYINGVEREKSQSLGREILEKEIQKCGMKPSQALKGKALEEAVQACGFSSFDSLLRAIGFGKISVRLFMEKFLAKDKWEELRKNQPAVTFKKQQGIPKRDSAIRIKCLDNDILWRIGKCCNPVPGDEIVGYITRGRGVSVHTSDCLSVASFSSESERFLEVEWHTDQKTSFPARISIVTMDKPGLLAKISSVLAGFKINITRANVQQGPRKRAYFDMSIEIFDLDHLNKALSEIRKVDGVVMVERFKESNKKFSGMVKQEKEEGGSPAEEKNFVIK